MPPAMVMRRGYRSPREAEAVAAAPPPAPAPAPADPRQAVVEPFTALSLDDALRRDDEWRRVLDTNASFLRG